MKIGYLLLLSMLMISGAPAQRITYSKPEKGNFGFDWLGVIGKRNNKILVYKSIFDPAPINYNFGVTVSQHSFLRSTLCFYDSNMNVIGEKRLPLPDDITGVHPLLYGDFFYLFYQCQKGNALYCMAARFDLEGNMIGRPVGLDTTNTPRLADRSMIYSCINSEDKKKILIFKVYDHSDIHTYVTSLLFDSELHLIHQSEFDLTMGGSEYLREFSVDNEGNFIFIGHRGQGSGGSSEQALLFRIPANKDTLFYNGIIPSTISVDDIRLLIDNTHKRYIISSFYSHRQAGNIEGLYTLVRDAQGVQKDIATTTELTEKARQQFKTGSGLKTVFNDYYLQSAHLRGDGSFSIEAQQLYPFPASNTVTRWNYHLYQLERVPPYFGLYDPDDPSHYYPFRYWGGGIGSRGSLIACFDTTGTLEWLKKINTPQEGREGLSLGYKSMVVGGRLYFLYNEDIRQRTYLTAQSIDAAGEFNTDGQLKEDRALTDQRSEYAYYPRLAQALDDGVWIVPCRWGRYSCLAKVEF